MSSTSSNSTINQSKDSFTNNEGSANFGGNVGIKPAVPTVIVTQDSSNRQDTDTSGLDDVPDPAAASPEYVDSSTDDEDDDDQDTIDYLDGDSDSDLDEEERRLQRTILRNFMGRTKNKLIDSKAQTNCNDQDGFAENNNHFSRSWSRNLDASGRPTVSKK